MDAYPAAAPIPELRPRLRGVQHAAAVPLVLAAAIVLLALSPTPATRVAAIAFSGAALANYSASAMMHLGSWGPRLRALVARVDHVSIFLLIAGSYTAIGLVMLTGADRIAMVSLAWAGAGAGIAFRLFNFGAPRWIHTAIYLVLGWLVVFFAKDLGRFPHRSVWILLAAGGACYTLGGLVYGLRRPNPLPRWFGFHEVFHTLTIAGFVSHYVAVSIAIYALR